MYKGNFPVKINIFLVIHNPSSKRYKIIIQTHLSQKNSNVPIKFSFVNPKILMTGIQICKEITKIETRC